MYDFKTWYYRQPSALRTIITINVGVWVAMQFLNLWGTGRMFVRSHLALHPVFPDILLEPWQLVTYSFMHTGLFHIGVNMLLLFWIGREFERMHGSEQFWSVYVTTAVGGALICLLLSPIAPSISGGMVGGRSIPVLGASASVLGVLTTVAILYPYKQIRLLFFGVVPLLWVVIGFLGIDALMALRPRGDTAVAAHWGGALTGFLYAKNQQGALGTLPGIGVLFRGRSSRRSGAGLWARVRGWFQSSSSSSDSPPTQRPSDANGASNASPSPTKRVDRILDKISEEGYDALSEEEKRILYEASES
ncbi:rhomboid family protein [Salinibacter altiplanensis]|uniref:rhomboid family protein n=1 Tax=Salinibacter altiplanensis TaxID=1803181 RepID=UPI001E2AD91D|nr:rhomboid family intramembrane serine protease [Salinibacter altiplanensis]